MSCAVIVVIVPDLFSIAGATTVISSSLCVVFSNEVFLTSALALKALAINAPHKAECPIIPRQLKVLHMC
jgi:hypothetical protein